MFCNVRIERKSVVSDAGSLKVWKDGFSTVKFANKEADIYMFLYKGSWVIS
jgi:hypothetical protein